jgi:hypothetical protein
VVLIILCNVGFARLAQMGREIENGMTDDIKDQLEHCTNMGAKSRDVDGQGLGAAFFVALFSIMQTGAVSFVSHEDTKTERWR